MIKTATDDGHSSDPASGDSLPAASAGDREGAVESFDVIIVGAGIAGSALSATLTPAGLLVLLLERQVEYRDRVRGEFMAPWGVVEMLNLGLDDVLIAAGGAYSTRLVNYDERTDPAKAEKRALPMDQVLQGAPGAFGIGHPDASTALRSLAQERGARVQVGVGDVEVTAGANPSVRYELGGEQFEALEPSHRGCGRPAVDGPSRTWAPPSRDQV